MRRGRAGRRSACYAWAVKIVRKYRRVFMLVFGLMAISGMTYGFLKRVGIDPLAAFRPDVSQEP